MIDFGVVYGVIISLFGTALVAFLSAGTVRLLRELGFEVSDRMKAKIEDAASWAAEQAVSYAKSRGKNLRTISVDNEVVAEGVQFLVDHADDALTYFGYTPSQLDQLVETRIEKVIARKRKEEAEADKAEKEVKESKKAKEGAKDA